MKKTTTTIKACSDDDCTEDTRVEDSNASKSGGKKDDASATKEQSLGTTEKDKKDSKADSSDKSSKSGKKRGKKDASTDEPKGKKMRVKPEKVLEVSEKLIDEMIKNYNFGMTEVPLDTLAAACGYKHPRSDAISAAIKLLTKNDILEKTKNMCKFTDKGIEQKVPKAKPAANPEEAMAQFWNHVEMRLEDSGTKVIEAAKAIFDLMKDGKAHSLDKMVEVTTYGMARSTGFATVRKTFESELKFIRKTSDGNFEFTDKMFPFGRP